MTVSPAACAQVRQLLVSTSADNVLQACGARTPCLLRSTASVGQALTELSRRRILSAPVVEEPPADTLEAPEESQGPVSQSGSQTADTLGFVDLNDMLCSFLHELKDFDINSMKLLQRMSVLEEQGIRFGSKQLHTLHTLGRDGGLMHVSQTKACLLELVMYGMLDPKMRGMHEGTTQRQVVHRIGFFNKEGSICSLVSQTDIVRFLAERISQLGPIAGESIEALGMVRRDVRCVNPETPAIVALSQMQEEQLSSLAVTDHAGRLIGNFSISDLRCITPAQFGALALPVGEYLARGNKVEYISYNRDSVAGTPGHRFVTELVHRKHPHIPGEDVGQQLVLGQASDTFGDVLMKIAGHGIHRLYVIDAEERPVGIVTCTDVLRKLVECSVVPSSPGHSQ